jgi:transcriptional regulator with XRE-family HTH domain
MTQQQLAEQVGIKFQQIQKYETGANRVSSSWLWDISEVMEVPVNFSLKILWRLMTTQRASTIFYTIKRP